MKNSFWLLGGKTTKHGHVRLWLCTFGIMLAMAVLAAIPSLTENSLATGGPTKHQLNKIRTSGYSQTEGNSLSLGTGRNDNKSTASNPESTGYQGATQAGQGSGAVVQGTVLNTASPQPTAPSDSDHTPPPVFIPTPVETINPPACYPKGIQPLNGCGRLFCPDAAGVSGCSGCGASPGPIEYACLVE